jgi:hypothetical protein
MVAPPKKLPTVPDLESGTDATRDARGRAAEAADARRPSPELETLPREHRDIPIRRARHRVAGMGMARAPERSDPGYLNLALVGVVLVAVLLTFPYLEPSGARQLKLQVGHDAPVVYYAGAALFALAFAGTGRAALRLSSYRLLLAALALGALGGCAGLSATLLVDPLSAWGELYQLTTVGSPLCAAAALLGYAGYGLVRAQQDLLGPRRNLGFGLMVLIMSLLAIAATLRMAQRLGVDLPSTML